MFVRQCFLPPFRLLSPLSRSRRAISDYSPFPQRERERERERFFKKNKKMVLSRVPFGAFVLVSLIFDLILPMIQAQSLAPAPAPASDGMSIDQGVAYMLMLVALVLTYLIHPLDASSFPYKLF